MFLVLLVLTFLESVAGTLLQRGIYFYTHEVRAFDETENLCLALGFGVTYVVGAFASHRLTLRFGERKLLLFCLGALLLLHALLASSSSGPVLVLAFFGTALVQGTKWPVIESYVSAGRSPKELLPILSRYNVTWAVAVFLAVGASGFVIGSGAPSLFFWIPAALNLFGIWLAVRLPSAPSHLEQGHPERPNPAQIASMQALLGSARWSMTASYALLFVLAPLMPTLLAQLGLAVTMATPVASALDGVRTLTFAVLGAWTGWHGRRLPLWLSMLALPLAFLLIVMGGSLPALLAGEVLFGIAGGFAYSAALYYALVSQNASVDAGGAHESLIGLGLGLGPLSGLAGQLLARQPLPGASAGSTLGQLLALVVAVTPIMAVCVLGSLRALFRLRDRPV